MRTVICKKEKCRLSILWTTAAWFWIAYGKDLRLTTTPLAQGASILNAKSFFEPSTTAGHWLQYLSSGPLAHYTKFSI